ncbi:MAG: cytochrome c family protein [Alphaproteobacteria bacterium]|nr:cytochrome c family protein [Alphaproteobacteria bacterium]
MKTFFVSMVVGLSVGGAVAYAVAHMGVHHELHFYTTPPAMSATAGLTPLSPDQAKAVLSPPKPAAPGAAPAAAAPAAAAKPAAPAAPAPAAPAPAAPAPAAPAAAAPAAAAPAAAAPAAAAPTAPAPAASASATPAAAPAAGDQLVAGERAFTPCKACHTLEAKGADRVGPSLHGVFGRKSGTKEGFKFSEAMTKAGVTWDDNTISQYLENPKAFIPGNRMAFPGVPKPETRAALVQFLKQATK